MILAGMRTSAVASRVRIFASRPAAVSPAISMWSIQSCHASSRISSLGVVGCDDEAGAGGSIALGASGRGAGAGAPRLTAAASADRIEARPAA